MSKTDSNHSYFYIYCYFYFYFALDFKYNMLSVWYDTKDVFFRHCVSGHGVPCTDDKTKVFFWGRQTTRIHHTATLENNLCFLRREDNISWWLPMHRKVLTTEQTFMDKSQCVIQRKSTWPVVLVVLRVLINYITELIFIYLILIKAFIAISEISLM